jgi:hypothetical protein
MGKKVVCEEKVAVYGDYDGNAPDTGNLVVVGTQEEANEVIADLELVLGSEVRDENNDEAKEALHRLEKQDVCVPYVDGWQHALSFRTREVYVPVEGFEIHAVR